MFYVISQYWLWELLALVLGAAIGWLTFTGEPGGWLRGWFVWALVAFGIGLVVAIIHLLPGRPGHYLETALALFFFYIAGGHIGAWLRWSLAAPEASVPAGAAAAFKSASPAGGHAASAPASTSASAPAATAALQGDRPSAAAAVAPGQASSSATKSVSTSTAAAAIANLASASERAGGIPAKGVAAAPAHIAARRPEALDGASGGRADPLTRIRSISQSDEARLNKAGIFHFGQIAAWETPEAKWAGAHLGAPGRAESENWVGQARGFVNAAARPDAAEAVQVVASAPPSHPLAGASTSVAASPAAPALPSSDSRHALARPAALDGADFGQPDDLTKIAGIDAATEAALNKLGVFHYRQIEAMTPEERAGLDSALAAQGGSATRGDWSASAATLAAAAATTAADAAAAKAAARKPAAPASAPDHPGARPASTVASGKSDNLKLIKGIGPKNEAILHGFGIWHFGQIAGWDDANQTWVGHGMAFPGRVQREHWVDQAKLLASGIETDHARDVRSGAVVMDDSADAPMDDAKIAEMQSTLPTIAAAVAGEDKHSGLRPLGLAQPRGGKADDLKRIRGIGLQNEDRLHKLGIWHFDQIAAWTREQVQWVGSYLAFPGRIDREQWIAQAKDLAQASDTASLKRAGAVPTSKS